MRRAAGSAFAIALAFVWIAVHPTSALAQSADANRLASIEARLQLVQEELRRLTGRLEQTEYENAQLKRTVEALQASLSRQSTLQPLQAPETTAENAAPAASTSTSATDGAEQAVGAIGDAPTIAVSTGSATTEAAANTNADQLETPAGQDSANAGQLLGTINRQALLGVDQGQGGTAASGADGTAIPDTPGALYNRGIGFLERGDWDRAVSDFRLFGERFPDHQLNTNASYWLGESLFYKGDFNAAAAQFSRNYQTVGENGPRAEENLLKVGLSLVELGQFETACQTFGELERLYSPLSGPVNQALLRGKATASCP